MVAMRMWHVTVQNMESLTGDALSDPFGRVAYKFVISAGATEAMDAEMFENAMQLELIKAIRSVKKEMIMKGMEP